jgi:hypothetical protein
MKCPFVGFLVSGVRLRVSFAFLDFVFGDECQRVQ